MTQDHALFTHSFMIAKKIGLALSYALERLELNKGLTFTYEAKAPDKELAQMTTEELARYNIDCALSMATLLNHTLVHLNDFDAAKVLSMLGEDGLSFPS
ncbi:hypothetical protein JJB07_16220 [Tumebacillus sp. ITR2]|uniref:Uncharacterized protein n=1 Tax=Tumebacillus amylolyticus TaxID=2801339 RepID=A0ABS1JD10_9BACL|nr:hypothetical protein [Tumebacillus amylolyticus]MBL0388164.1 hypothetical protein [Tumebacillus amylolyticus]